MQRNWWLFAVGGVGIALTFLIFPKPDTGGSFEPDQQNTDPLNFKQGPADKRTADGPRTVTALRRVDGPKSIVGPNPIAARMMAERNTPEGMTAARMSAPWTVVRRELILSGNAEAKTFGEDLAELVVDLRNMRREPGKIDFNALMDRHQAKIDELKSHADWVDNEVIEQQLTRLEDVRAAYERGDALAPFPTKPTEPADGATPTTAPTQE